MNEELAREQYYEELREEERHQEWLESEEDPEPVKITDLKWSNSPPTKEGYYWRRDNDTRLMHMVYIKDDEEWWMTLFEPRHPGGAEYLGPIPEPSILYGYRQS